MMAVTTPECLASACTFQAEGLPRTPTTLPKYSLITSPLLSTHWHENGVSGFTPPMLGAGNYLTALAGMLGPD